MSGHPETENRTLPIRNIWPVRRTETEDDKQGSRVIYEAMQVEQLQV